MQNLPKNNFQDYSTQTKTAFGMLIRFSSPLGISSGYEARAIGDFSWWTYRVYHDGAYTVRYLKMNNQGIPTEELIESEGVLPKFLIAPDHSVWVSLTYTKIDG